PGAPRTDVRPAPLRRAPRPLPAPAHWGRGRSEPSPWLAGAAPAYTVGARGGRAAVPPTGARLVLHERGAGHGDRRLGLGQAAAGHVPRRPLPRAPRRDRRRRGVRLPALLVPRAPPDAELPAPLAQPVH